MSSSGPISEDDRHRGNIEVGLLRVRAVVHPDAEDLVWDHGVQEPNLLEAVLRAGVETGEFRKLDPKLTTMAWLGMHNYTYLWLKPGGRVSARDAAKPFADIFIKGIAAS